MLRYLGIALPVLLLAIAVFYFAVDASGFGPERAPLARLGVARADPAPALARLAGWGLEALALTALFLLIQGRAGAWWLDGLATGLIAWIFRGPLLVLAVEETTRLPRQPFWSLTLGWLVLYPFCGLLLAALAQRARLERP